MANIGESRLTNSILRMIGEDSRNEIDSYINDVCNRDFIVMRSLEHVNNIFGDSLDNFISSLSEDELLDLRAWTSYNFSNINSILRNNWTYEKNGFLSEEKKVELKGLANRISEIFSKYDSPNLDFITFRGTTIGSFSQYGITNLSDLECLKDKFMYEQGFTSTSVIESSCYFKKNFNDGKKYNIQLRYLVPSESMDGVLLMGNDSTYYNNEDEYLIDKGTLSKVIDVKVDRDNDVAILTLALVPKNIYDKCYSQNRTALKTN